ncbi:MAG: alpha/beta hydrolase, partial [Bacteroidota bacterium]
IFFIAGGPGGTHYGLRSFDSLSTTNTLVYFDGFGRGKSDTAKNVKEYTLERDIEDLEGLRKAMGYSTINVLGHSYGGVVAQGYAVKYPEHVKHLILANSFHSFVMWQENDDNSNHEIKTNYPEVWDTLMKIREKGAISSDGDHQQIYGKVPYGFLYAYNPDKFISRGRKPYPNSFNAKLYYQMVGKDGFDRVAVPWMMVKYKEYCPQAKFVMFERSGHNPQVEEPAKEFALIREFLQ